MGVDIRRAPRYAFPMTDTARRVRSEIVSKPSPLSVDDTVAADHRRARRPRAELFAVIDHSGEARANGLELRDTKVVIFGNPKGGTPVMQAAPLAAIDLPLKLLVWADGDQTKISYTDPAALAARYGLSDELRRRWPESWRSPTPRSLQRPVGRRGDRDLHGGGRRAGELDLRHPVHVGLLGVTSSLTPWRS